MEKYRNLLISHSFIDRIAARARFFPAPDSSPLLCTAPRPRSHPLPLPSRICLALALCVLAGLAAGCGKKSWPSPAAGQDRFTFRQVLGQKEQDCLNITVRLSGKHQNLRGFVLELESKAEPCPGCPFQPTETVDLPLSSAKISRTGPVFFITWCGLAADKAYRWRLKGVNVFPTIEDAVTEVQRLE